MAYGHKKSKNKKSKNVKSVKKIVKKELQLLADHKQYAVPNYTGNGNVMPDSSWQRDANFTPLNISLGNSDSTRVANKVKLLNVKVSQIVSFSGDYTDATEPESKGIRCVIFQLKKNATLTDLDQALSQGPDYSSSKPFGLLDDLKTHARIMDLVYVLYDKVHMMPPTSQLMFVDSTQTPAKVITKIVQTPYKIETTLKPKVKNITWKPNTSSGNPDEIGGIYMYYFHERIGYSGSQATSGPIYYNPGWQTNYIDV